MGLYEKYDDTVKFNLVQYVSPTGRLAIADWRSSLSVTRMADLDIFLRTMLKKSKWAYPDICGLSGKHLKGFVELRWRSESGVPHRIGGYFETQRDFVMLVGWTHNHKKYDPPTALDILIERKKKIQRGEATICEYKVLTGKTA